jgi:hypothetical protein
MYPAPPAPKTTGQKWIAFGAVVVVALGASFGANLLKKRLNGSLPSPSAAASESAPPPAEAKASAPSAPSAPQVDDGPAPPPGTPQGSLRARPPWGRLALHTRGEPTQEYAPQHAKPVDVFTKASSISGDVQRAFVICRAQSFAKADTFAGDDLHVRATFGKTPEVAADGPEDANLGFVSAPLVSLAKEEIVHVAVFDRDVLDLTNLARVNITFQGTPIVVADPGATIECRALAGDALAARVAIDAGAADQIISTLAGVRLDGKTSDWHYPFLDITRAHRAIGDVAALVGWDDVRTKKRIDALASSITSVDAQRSRVFDELRSGAEAETTVDGVKVSFVSMECGPKVGLAGLCAVKLLVANGSGRAIRWNGYQGPMAYVATRDSGPVIVAPTQSNLVLKDIPADTSVDVTLHTPDDRPAREAAIAGICIERRCGVIKLR